MSLSIVIPAKNESGAIASVVSVALEKFPDAEVIVVDDGSDDDTAKVAIDAGAKVVTFDSVAAENAQGVFGDKITVRPEGGFQNGCA